MIITKVRIVATSGYGEGVVSKRGWHKSFNPTVLVMFYFISWAVRLLFIRFFFFVSLTYFISFKSLKEINQQWPEKIIVVHSVDTFYLVFSSSHLLTLWKATFYSSLRLRQIKSLNEWPLCPVCCLLDLLSQSLVVFLSML